MISVYVGDGISGGQYVNWRWDGQDYSGPPLSVLIIPTLPQAGIGDGAGEGLLLSVKTGQEYLVGIGDGDGEGLLALAAIGREFAAGFGDGDGEGLLVTAKISARLIVVAEIGDGSGEGLPVDTLIMQRQLLVAGIADGSGEGLAAVPAMGLKLELPDIQTGEGRGFRARVTHRKPTYVFGPTIVTPAYQGRTTGGAVYQGQTIVEPVTIGVTTGL